MYVLREKSELLTQAWFQLNIKSNAAHKETNTMLFPYPVLEIKPI